MTVVKSEKTVEVTLWRVRWRVQGPVHHTYKTFEGARTQYNRRAQDGTLQGMEYVDEGPVSHVGAEEETSTFAPSTRRYRVIWWGDTTHSLSFTSEKEATKFRREHEKARTFLGMTKNVTTYYE